MVDARHLSEECHMGEGGWEEEFEVVTVKRGSDWGEPE